MHYYQFNIGDYRADTAHLNIIEHGIYRQLIDWYYLDEKQIPKETQVVMRRLSLGSDELHLLENVLNDFFFLTDLGYFHARIERDIQLYQTQSAKNRVNGKLGGRPCKPIESSTKTQVVIDGLSKETQVDAKHNPNQEPRTNNQELLTTNYKPILKPTRKITLDIGFDEFWNIYPKKTGKDKALIAWNKKKPNIDHVICALIWQKESEQWNKDRGQFVPNPTTYINEGRWKDEPPSERNPF
jgi:uncharacterized protein YdaU (DUF1376 family)